MSTESSTKPIFTASSEEKKQTEDAAPERERPRSAHEIADDSKSQRRKESEEMTAMQAEMLCVNVMSQAVAQFQAITQQVTALVIAKVQKCESLEDVIGIVERMDERAEALRQKMLKRNEEERARRGA